MVDIIFHITHCMGGIQLAAYLYIQYLSIKPVQSAFPFIKGSLELPNTRVTLSISTTMLWGPTPQIHTCKVIISLKITRLSTVYHSHTIRYPVCHTRMFTPTYKHIPRDKVEEGITHIGLLVLIHMRVLTYKLDPTHREIYTLQATH